MGVKKVAAAVKKTELQKVEQRLKIALDDNIRLIQRLDHVHRERTQLERRLDTARTMLLAAIGDPELPEVPF